MGRREKWSFQVDDEEQAVCGADSPENSGSSIFRDISSQDALKE